MTPLALAHRFAGLRELPGSASHPFIVWAHSLCHLGNAQPDAVPWCSSFVNAIAWMLDLTRSESAAARSWLLVGQPVELEQAAPGFDVVVLRRGASPAAGHVGFYVGPGPGGLVYLLGGNQGDAVGVAAFKVDDILGVRRLVPRAPIPGPVFDRRSS